MESTAVVFDIITIIISVILCIKNIKNVIYSTRAIFYYIFVAFYVLPLFLDYLYKMPSYDYSWYIAGFALSQTDTVTRIIYDASIIFCQYFVLKYKNSSIDGNCLEHQNNFFDSTDLDTGIDHFLLILAIAPIAIVLVFSSSKGAIYSFQWVENSIFVRDKWLQLGELLSYPAMAAATLLVRNRNKGLGLRIFCALLLYCDICIQGKRSALFFVILVFLITSIPGIQNKFENFQIRRKKLFRLILLALIALLIMIMTSITVQNARSGTSLETDILYTTLRVDFFRDDRVRMAIYSIIHPDEIHILDYPLQSLLPIPTWFFPIDYILSAFNIDFPSYAAYFSAGVELLPLESSMLNMTPCVFAELLSNFGFLGILFMPLLMVKFASITEKQSYPVNVLTIIIFVSLQMYAIKYIIYLIEVYLIILIAKKLRIVIVVRR